MTIAIIASDERAFNDTRLAEVDAADWPKCVHVYDMSHCDSRTFSRVVRTCLWFGDDLLVECERRLRVQSVDHSFGCALVHDDFTVVGDAVQFSVFLPTGGTQLVRLSRDDIGSMADAMS